MNLDSSLSGVPTPVFGSLPNNVGGERFQQLTNSSTSLLSKDDQRQFDIRVICCCCRCKGLKTHEKHTVLDHERRNGVYSLAPSPNGVLPLRKSSRQMLDKKRKASSLPSESDHMTSIHPEQVKTPMEVVKENTSEMRTRSISDSVEMGLKIRYLANKRLRMLRSGQMPKSACTPEKPHFNKCTSPPRKNLEIELIVIEDEEETYPFSPSTEIQLIEDNVKAGIGIMSDNEKYGDTKIMAKHEALVIFDGTSISHKENIFDTEGNRESKMSDLVKQSAEITILKEEEKKEEKAEEKEEENENEEEEEEGEGEEEEEKEEEEKADAEFEEDAEKDCFAHIWKDMEIATSCLKDHHECNLGTSENLSAPTKDDEISNCQHAFSFRDDVGFVCDICGLVGRSIESIFDDSALGITWRKRRKRAVEQKQAVELSSEFTSEKVQNINIDDMYPSEVHVVRDLCLNEKYVTKMFNHQVEGFQVLKGNLVSENPGGCIIAHAPGTGKTFLIITFILSFLKSYPEERPLIIAPKGMIEPWVSEFRKWTKGKKVPLLTLYRRADSAYENLDGEDDDLACGSEHRKKQLQILREWRGERKVLILSYNQFANLVCDKNAEIQRTLCEVPGLLVLDEGHYSRNSGTKALKSLRKVQTPRKVILSGTLFQNNFEELFNLLMLVRPNFVRRKEARVGSTTPRRTHADLKFFQEQIASKIELGNDEERLEAAKSLRGLIEPFVHWYKGELLEGLPGLVDLSVFLKLNTCQKEKLISVEKEAENSMKRYIMSMLVSIHPCLSEMKTPWLDFDLGGTPPSAALFSRDGVKAKFVVNMLSLCERVKEKVLVFSQWLAPLALLETMLVSEKNWIKGTHLLRIDGACNHEQREEIIRRFNTEHRFQVLFASIKACGEGVSLIGASRIILLDTHYNPAVTQQAISRAFRYGQTKKVFVYRLVGSETCEEYAFNLSAKKERIGRLVFEDPENTSLDPHEVQPESVDILFENPNLKEDIMAVVLNNIRGAGLE